MDRDSTWKMLLERTRSPIFGPANPSPLSIKTASTAIRSLSNKNNGELMHARLKAPPPTSFQ
jgi:hypothetical protein